MIKTDQLCWEFEIVESNTSSSKMTLAAMLLNFFFCFTDGQGANYKTFYGHYFSPNHKDLRKKSVLQFGPI